MPTPRKPTTEITVIPPGGQGASQFFDKQVFRSLPFFERLNKQDQSQFLQESEQLVSAMGAYGLSKLAVGKSLARIEEILTPYKAWTKFLAAFDVNANAGYTARTARRLIKSYNKITKAWPEPIIRAAMAKGINVLAYNDSKPFGRYTKAVEVLDLPEVVNDFHAKRYVDQLEDTRKMIARKERREGKSMDEADELETNPHFLTRKAFQAIKTLLKNTPPRQRKAVLDELIGMTLAQAGISNPVTFSPIAVSDEFKRGPGRPPLQKSEDEERKLLVM